MPGGQAQDPPEQMALIALKPGREKAPGTETTKYGNHKLCDFAL